MSISVNVSNTSVTVKEAVAAEQVTIDGDVKILRIVDLPEQTTIRVFVDKLPDPITLSDLSGDNYGSDWTYADVKTAVSDYITAN